MFDRKRKLIEKEVEAMPPEPTPLLTKAGLEAAIHTALNPPKETMLCEVEQRTYFALDAKGFRHAQDVTYEGRHFVVCGPCSHWGQTTRLEAILDYLASRKLGWAKGTRREGVGEVLLPYVLAKVPLRKITPEQLAHDFDRHPRFSNKPRKALAFSEKVDVTRIDQSSGRPYKAKAELVNPIFDPGFDPDNPGRSNYRPPLASERQAQEIDALEIELKNRMVRNESRKAKLDRDIVALQEVRSEL